MAFFFANFQQGEIRTLRPKHRVECINTVQTAVGVEGKILLT